MRVRVRESAGLSAMRYSTSPSTDSHVPVRLWSRSSKVANENDDSIIILKGFYFRRRQMATTEAKPVNVPWYGEWVDRDGRTEMNLTAAKCYCRESYVWLNHTTWQDSSPNGENRSRSLWRAEGKRGRGGVEEPMRNRTDTVVMTPRRWMGETAKNSHRHAVHRMSIRRQSYWGILFTFGGDARWWWGVRQRDIRRRSINQSRDVIAAAAASARSLGRKMMYRWRYIMT